MVSSLGAAIEADSVPCHASTTHRWSLSPECGLTARPVAPGSLPMRTASGALGSRVTARSSGLTCSAMSWTLANQRGASVLICVKPSSPRIWLLQVDGYLAVGDALVPPAQ